MVKCRIEQIELPDVGAGSASGDYYQTRALLADMLEYIGINEELSDYSSEHRNIGLSIVYQGAKKKGKKRKFLETANFPVSAVAQPKTALEILRNISCKVVNWGTFPFSLKHIAAEGIQGQRGRIVICKGLGHHSSGTLQSSTVFVVQDIVSCELCYVDETELCEIPESQLSRAYEEVNEFVRQRMLVGIPANVHEKYWDQRYRIFSRFDQGIQLDPESWFSATYECIGEEFASNCLQRAQQKGFPISTVWDGFSGCGGTGISFCRRGLYVTAVDIDAQKLRYFKHNAGLYGASNFVECLQQDIWQSMWMHARQKQFNAILNQMIKKNLITQESFDLFPFRPASPLSAGPSKAIKQEKLVDLFVLCPPWGGPDYLNVESWDFRTMMPCGDGYLLTAMAYSVAKNVALVLPRNTSEAQMKQLSLLLGTPCLIQEMNIRCKCKLIIACFGTLFQ